MADWPPSLKPISKYMARGREVETEQPTVAYYCFYYSLTKAIELRDASDESANRFVTGLLEKCEIQKEALPPDNGTHRGIVEEFALRVFDRADDEDRADKATKATARTFYAAMCFLEICSIFAPLTQDLDERLRYAKWKAADITKALREGRRPLPGAPGEAEARAKEEEAQEKASGEAIVSDSLPIPPAPPVVEYDVALDRAEDNYPPTAPKYPSSDAPSPLKHPESDKALEPQYPPLDIGAAPRNAPPAPPGLELPGQPAPPALDLPVTQKGGAFDLESLKSVNAKVQPYVSPTTKQTLPPVQHASPPGMDHAAPVVLNIPPVEPIPPVHPVRPVDPIPPVQPPVIPPPVAQSTAPAAPPPRAANPHFKPSVRQTQEAQRLAKYAASALDFQDIKTAVSNLERALQLLQGQ